MEPDYWIIPGIIKNGVVVPQNDTPFARWRPCRNSHSVSGYDPELKSELDQWNQFWAAIPEFGGRYLRVITLDDKITYSQRFSRPRIQAMKLNYYPETDSLYIDLSEQSSVESREISEGIVLDYDADGRLVGIDIDNASNKVEMKKLILSKLPSEIEMTSA